MPRAPENYSGTAIGEDVPTNDSAEKTANPWEKTDDVPKKEERTAPVFADLFSGKGLGGLFRGGGIRGLVKDFGMEEVLIIAVAVFLLLSKDGDKECAVMLLLLLVV